MSHPRRAKRWVSGLLAGLSVVLASTGPAVAATADDAIRTLANARLSPSPLTFDPRQLTAVLRTVDDVSADLGRAAGPGLDYAVTARYEPLTGSLQGIVFLTRLAHVSPKNALATCWRDQRHTLQVVRSLGRYHGYYCPGDISFAYSFAWQKRTYVVAAKYYGGVTPGGLRRLVGTLIYAG